MEQTHRQSVARILCDDARLCRFYENEASFMGFHPDNRDEADLVLWDADHTPVPKWGELSSNASLIVITRDTIPDGISVPDFRRTDLLRRPFNIESLERLLSLYAESFFHAHEPPRVVPSHPTGIVPTDDFSSVTVEGNPVSLSPQEGRILSCLWDKRGRTVTREELASLLGGSVNGNSVEVYVCHLRRKLETPTSPRLIRTVRGKGYILE